MRTILAAALILMATAAGCLNAATDQSDLAQDTTGAPRFPPVVPPAPDFDWVSVVDPDHPSHNLPQFHAKGRGLSLTGHTGVQHLLPTGVSGSITQVDVWENYALVTGMDGDLGFVILDITDPKSPKAISWFPSIGDDWTARFSDDGKYVFLGCQVLPAFQPVHALKGSCEDAHKPTGGFAKGGVTVVDVADKTKPTFVTFLPTTASHNLQVATIGGFDYVFTNAVDILKFDRETLTLTKVGHVPGIHDATVAQHPVTGDWLLYTGTKQLAIWNVSDPADPKAVFEGGIEGVVGWHEQTVIPGLIEGRYLLALAGESFLGAVPNPESKRGVPDVIAIVDITDPLNPVKLSTWSPPFAEKTKVPWVSYLYSAHEIAATPTGQVAIAWYHAGVWVIDVSTRERMEAPVTLAAYLPNKLMNVHPATFAQTPLPHVPFVWGAGWDSRGYLIVPDMHTGVYVLEPEWGLHPALDSGQ